MAHRGLGMPAAVAVGEDLWEDQVLAVAAVARRLRGLEALAERVCLSSRREAVVRPAAAEAAVSAPLRRLLVEAPGVVAAEARRAAPGGGVRIPTCMVAGGSSLSRCLVDILGASRPPP